MAIPRTKSTAANILSDMPSMLSEGTNIRPWREQRTHQLVGACMMCAPSAPGSHQSLHHRLRRVLRHNRSRRNGPNQDPHQWTFETIPPRSGHEAQPSPRLEAVALCRERLARYGGPGIRWQVRVFARATIDGVAECRVAHAT